MREIVLASASDRRTKILEECGIPHRVVVSGADESIEDGQHVSDVVQNNAKVKSETVAAKEPEAIIIGADTLVVHGKDIIGKPEGESAARELLKKFSGENVAVYTGLCVMDPSSGREAVGVEKSDLSVVSLDDNEVERFFRLMGLYDKAGGFSIEGVGSLLFDDIRGSYFNILGLPMMKLRGLFADIGLEIMDFIANRK